MHLADPRSTTQSSQPQPTPPFPTTTPSIAVSIASFCKRILSEQNVVHDRTSPYTSPSTLRPYRVSRSRPCCAFRQGPPSSKPTNLTRLRGRNTGIHKTERRCRYCEVGRIAFCEREEELSRHGRRRSPHRCEIQDIIKQHGSKTAAAAASLLTEYCITLWSQCFPTIIESATVLCLVPPAKLCAILCGASATSV
jgi:hypothetical protein